MTAINWIIYPDQGIVIYTDTLLSDARTRTPTAFGSKAFPLHDCNMIVGTKGDARMTQAWINQLCLGMLFRNLDQLDLYTPEALRSLSKVSPCAVNTEIKHFGYCNGQYKVYTYTSENNWESIVYTEGKGFGPNFDGIADCMDLLDSNDIDSIRKLMHLQQKASTSDCCIGGHIMRYGLTSESITIQNLGPYDDYEQMYDAANLGRLLK
jgi:hypothetical protein